MSATVEIGARIKARGRPDLRICGRSGTGVIVTLADEHASPFELSPSDFAAYKISEPAPESHDDAQARGWAALTSERVREMTAERLERVGTPPTPEQVFAAIAAAEQEAPDDGED